MFINIRKIAQITSPFRSKLITKAYSPWLKEKEKILDIGCGNGITSKIIMNNFKVDATGCDVKKYLDVNMPFYLIPKNGKLPFKNKSFDAAIINDVLHHIDKPYQEHIIKEALRVAEKVLIFEVEPTLSGKIFDMLLNKLHYQSLQTPLAFRWRKDWIKLFKKMGLSYTTQSVRTPPWYPFLNVAIMIKEKKNK